MSSTALRRLTATVSLAFAIGWPGAVLAAKVETGAAVVARLYKEFAWMAIGGQPELFGVDLPHQPKPFLEKYFDPALASLLVADAKCQAKYQGLCNIDFDLLFASQDPRVIDLDVQMLSAGKVSVEFKDPVSEKKTRLEFRGTAIAGKWRITDVIYPSMDDVSLKQILLRKMP